MCNGDLGMYRVMPWAYPTIPGQSSGGTSVDPTPEPSPEYYDFSGAKITCTEDTLVLDSIDLADYKNRGYAYFQVSGIKTLDSSVVDHVTIRLKEKPTYTPSLSGTVTMVTAINVGKDPNSYFSMDFITNDASNTGKTITVSGGSFTFSVYNADGEVIQFVEVAVS